jgi:hypothetical protein
LDLHHLEILLDVLNVFLSNMKASSRGRLAPWTRLRASRAEEARHRETTPDQLPDDDLFPLALWNACATDPISPCALAAASVVDAVKRECYKGIMCNQGSPGRRAWDDADEDEGSRSAGEESLWTSGKPAMRVCSSVGHGDKCHAVLCLLINILIICGWRWMDGWMDRMNDGRQEDDPAWGNRKLQFPF